MRSIEGIKKNIFVCSECGCTETFVVDSRKNNDDKVQLRRHCCRQCGNRWNTIELMVSEYEDLFVKTEKHQEEEMNNLLSSLTNQLIKANALMGTINKKRNTK